MFKKTTSIRSLSQLITWLGVSLLIGSNAGCSSRSAAPPVASSAGSGTAAAGAGTSVGSAGMTNGGADRGGLGGASAEGLGGASGSTGIAGDFDTAGATGLGGFAGANGGNTNNAGSDGEMTVGTGVPVASGLWRMVDATQVKLLAGSPFYDRQQTHIAGYGASWDPDKLLYPFRSLAKLPQASGVTAGYAGWDTTILKGHMTGHYLSAASRWAVATGDTSFTTKVNYLVNELGKVQTALGGGNLRAFADNDSKVGAPYYVDHKVLAGLVDAYTYLGNQQALTIAQNFAKHINTDLASTNFAGNSELGAMTDVLTELYQITNDKTYLTLAAKFEPSSFISPLAQNQDQLKGLHGNMHIAFVVGGARYANVTSDATETSASANFWSIVTAHHSYVNGGDSVHEWFDAPNVEATNLPYSTTEACNSNNMLKITARLIERKPAVNLGDYFERTLYNHVLAAVAPDTGRLTYFLPMHGDFRTYLDGTFCCVGTGLESTGRYGEGIYYENDNQLLVNLYIPSTLNWTGQGLTIEQQGYLPQTDTVTLRVTQALKPVQATIQFRIPGWVSDAVSVTVNGHAVATTAKAGSYLSLERIWSFGDAIALTLPATLRIEHAKDQSDMIAVFYGPVALAGELGSANMPNDVATSQDAYKNVSPAIVPDIVNVSPSPADWLTLTDRTTLSFKMLSAAGPAAGLTLAPLYAVHHQRYTVYWKLRAQ